MCPLRYSLFQLLFDNCFLETLWNVANFGLGTSCPDPIHKGLVSRVLGLAEALKPCNCVCKNTKMSLIVV